MALQTTKARGYNRFVDYFAVVGPKVVDKQFLRTDQRPQRRDSHTITPITQLALVHSKEDKDIPLGFERVQTVEGERVRQYFYF